ncbi:MULTISPECIES: DUF2806 domain-containing protein [Rhizobium/Agrobacterium group]|uniref:DUF2806 domain-containing protein n=1 Tax=Rhizobium/Agrobacterium group TaxID=227290 RepID=UPI001574193F|nr:MULTISPECIES: DUF2806 domain-containing protein [Rhizobium/Agrobacterium group]MCF1446615.1 DUF2806 domain-containing protein [Allorhizobium ampelinum]NSZ53461.1 DUF2806 domain-containing protein [Agrobacterium vitis]NTA32220.1 DUF2806 domain-containing protein [Agrobacterium vitis]
MLPVNLGGSDVLGLGAFSKEVIGPIIRGVGNALEPIRIRLTEGARGAQIDYMITAMEARGLTIEKMEYSLTDRTEVRVLAESMRQQNNREEVAAATVKHAIEDKTQPQPDIAPPSLEWIDKFWSLAEKVSDPDMQAFWGKVLSRRASRRAAVSARTLDFISLLSGEEAQAIELLSRSEVRTIGEGGEKLIGVIDHIGLGWDDVSLMDTNIIERGASMSARLFEPIRLVDFDLLETIGFLRGRKNHFLYQPSGKKRLAIANVVIEADLKPPANHKSSVKLDVARTIGLTAIGEEIFEILKSDPHPVVLEVMMELMTLLGCDPKRMPDDRL